MAESVKKQDSQDEILQAIQALTEVVTLRQSEGNQGRFPFLCRLGERTHTRQSAAWKSVSCFTSQTCRRETHACFFGDQVVLVARDVHYILWESVLLFRPVRQARARACGPYRAETVPLHMHILCSERQTKNKTETVYVDFFSHTLSVVPYIVSVPQALFVVVASLIANFFSLSLTSFLLLRFAVKSSFNAGVRPDHTAQHESVFYESVFFGE